MDGTQAPPPDRRDPGVYPLFLRSLSVSVRHLPTLFAIYFPLAALSSVLLFVGAPTFADPPQYRPLVIPPSEWLAIAGWMLCIISFGSWSSAALYRSAEEAFDGRPVPGFAAAYGAAVERVPALFATQLLYGLMAGAGFVLCVVPGLWAIVLLAPALPRAVLRDSGPLAALREARALVLGRWWRVAGYLMLVMVTIYSLVVPYFMMSFVLPHGEAWAHALRAIGNAISTTLIAAVQTPAYVALNEWLEETA